MGDRDAGAAGERDTAHRATLKSDLLKWLAVFGVFNVLLLSAGLGWVYLVTPEKILEDASEKVAGEIRRQVAPYRDEVQRSGSTALSESARVQERVSIIDRDLDKLGGEIEKLRGQVTDLENGEVIAVARISELLERNPEAADTLELAARVARLESSAPGTDARQGGLECKQISNTSETYTVNDQILVEVNMTDADRDAGYLLTGGGCAVLNNSGRTFLLHNEPLGDNSGWLCRGQYVPNRAGSRAIRARAILCRRSP
jgi:hypothetical protein